MPAFLDRSVDIGLQRDLAATAQPLVGRDDDPRAAIGNPARKRVGRKAAEDDGMDGTDPGAGQHGEGGLRDHRHVDRDGVALADSLRLQHVGEAADLRVEVAIGDRPRVLGVVAFPKDRDLVALVGEVSVDAVRRDVGGAVAVPFDRDGTRRIGRGLHAAVGLDPVDPHAVLAPEAGRVAHRAGVHLLVAVRPDKRVVPERLGHVVDVGHHGVSSRAIGLLGAVHGGSYKAGIPLTRERIGGSCVRFNIPAQIFGNTSSAAARAQQAAVVTEPIVSVTQDNSLPTGSRSGREHADLSNALHDAIRSATLA